MARIYEAIDVHAPAERVWQILMDFASYPEWNPFVLRLDGEAREGAPLKGVMRVGGQDVPVELETVRVAAPREFAWAGGFRFRFLLNAVHWFKVEPIDAANVRFVQEELIHGLLAPLMMFRMRADIERQFVAMNEAVKRRAEAGVAARGSGS